MSALGLQLNDFYFIVLIGACAVALQQASADGSRDAPIYALLDWEHDKMSGRDRVNCMINFVGLFVDYFVLHLHYNNAYHPRFYMNARGRFFIILHLTSGSLEIFALNLALFVNDFSQLSVIAGCTAIFGHAVSSFYHTPGCMGSKRMAVSGYAMVICLHTYVAYDLLQDPHNVSKMILLNCVIHTYAWVRANIGLYIYFDMFPHNRYSVSMSWAVFMMLSSFGSPALTFGFIGGVAFWCLLMVILGPYFPQYHWLADKHDVDYGQAMTSLDAAKSVMGAKLPAHWDELSDRGQAAQVFHQFDKDNSGEITIQEAKGLMHALGLPTKIAVEYIGKFDSRGTGKLTFEDFYDMLWSTDNIKSRLTADFALMSGDVIPPRDAPDEEKCKCVFKLIDLDGNNELSVTELAALLDSWGMPFPERNAKNMVAKTDKPGLMHFDEFYKNAKTIWMYAYGNMRWELDNMVQDRTESASRKSFMDPQAAVARRRSRMGKKTGQGPAGKGTIRKTGATTQGKAPPGTPATKPADEPRRSSVRFLATMAEFED